MKILLEKDPNRKIKNRFEMQNSNFAPNGSVFNLVPGATVHHLDYNNNFQKVIIINANKSISNIIHQFLHFIHDFNISDVNSEMIDNYVKFYYYEFTPNKVTSGNIKKLTFNEVVSLQNKLGITNDVNNY